MVGKSKYSQVYNTHSMQWEKIENETGRIVNKKTDPGKYKNLPVKGVIV